MAPWEIERKSDSVVVVKMNSNKANVITKQFMQQFKETLDVLEQKYPNDSVVLTGNGKFFSAGLDLKFMAGAQATNKHADLVTYIETFDNLVARLYAFPRPVVAAIEGHAIAGGTCIACACDFRISNGKGNFGMNEVQNGMSVPFNMLQIVKSAVSSRASWNIFLTGRVFDAKEAQKLGVVDEIVSAEKLLERAVEVATYQSQSMAAYGSIKGLLQRHVLETMKANKGFTRNALETQYKIKSKL
eukprot:TRINITY_DN4764_c0_g2_i1.p2 TRINITY_DN4764_c0_g2~~TRINITY_DN4764_c0_g2_i1.p2  ORF type:complete len:271 (-),score=121.13 TRINITY_DN4764_c0_g2_i1:82-813(-)